MLLSENTTGNQQLNPSIIFAAPGSPRLLSFYHIRILYLALFRAFRRGGKSRRNRNEMQ